MPEETDPRTGSKLLYFVIGLGLGSLISILFAPKSGDQAREYLSEKTNKLKSRAARAVEHGRNMATEKKEQLAAAVDAGREVYKQESTKAKAAGTPSEG